jgi:hypothetical protein
VAKKLLEAQAGVSVQETEVDRFARDLHAQHGGVDALDQIESIVGARIQDAGAGWRRTAQHAQDFCASALHRRSGRLHHEPAAALVCTG